MGFARFRRFGPVALAGLLLASAVAAEPAPAWPLSGGVGGELRLAFLPELGLPWRVEVDAKGLVLRAERPGVDLALVLRPRPGGEWSWEIGRGELDLAELWPALRQSLGAAAAGWSASGRITLAGAGTWSSESAPRGELRVAVREGWARSDELEAELDGVELDLATREPARRALAAGQILRVAKLSAAGVEIEALRLELGLSEAGVLEVAGGEAGFLGGRVRLRPFCVPLEAPAVTAAADVDGLRLDQAARLLPWLFQTAQGKLRGRVELSWDAIKGLGVRDGGLEVVKADAAAFRLAPSPGLLTGKLPPRFSVLPWRWARWVGIKNPAYGPLKEIELGREGLRIESLEVKFWPDGAGRGRTATIQIKGRPTSGKFVDVVNLGVNFHGPWTEFIAFGLNNDLSGFSFRVD